MARDVNSPMPPLPEDPTQNLTFDPSGSGAAGADPTVAGAGIVLNGATIGPYRVLSLLGEGGFGDIYLAEQAAPVRRPVALKVIKPGMDSRQVVARFEQERQTLALMDHPGLARIYDAGVTPPALGSRPYFAMELVRGEPIHRYCEHEHPTLEERVRLMIQVCAAVQHAHMRGIIHRDLKPSNILVETVDGKPVPKVIDFGVAKALHGPLSDSTLYTEAGQLVGTPEYMAPEQARGSVDIDTRADVYALGAILYHLLTGVPPLESSTLRGGAERGFIQKLIEEQVPPRPSDRIATQIRTADASARGTPEDPRTLSRRLRGDLDWIVMKCLEKERARRYASASELAADLERYLRNEPVTAGPPSASYRIGKFVRRHRVAVIGVAGVAVALVLAAAGTGAGMAWAMRERSRAEAARRDSDAVTNFLTDMLASVDPSEKGGRRDVTVSEVLDRAAAKLASGFEDRPLIEARLRHAIANSLRAIGRLDDSEPHLRRALELRRAHLGANHLDTLRALANLASLRLEQGRLSEAQQLTYDAVEGLRATLGPDHAMTLGVMNNLAQLYERLGRAADAKSIQREVLDGQRRTLGDAHEYTLGSMLNLASLHQADGEFDQARSLLNEALDGFRRHHGPDHPGTLLAQSNLAMLLSARGEHEAAESLQRGVLESRRRVLGEEHPGTIGTLTNLGLILGRAGRAPEAEETYARAWNLARDHLGPTHPTTVTTALNLLAALEAQGWPERSHTTAARVLAAVGALAAAPDAPPLTLNNTAWFMLTAEPAELRNPTGALPLARRAVERARADNNPDLWMYLDTLAKAEHAAGDAATAAAYQREAITLIPPHGERFRDEMRERLEMYEAAAGR